jgi:hypothetical protein
MPIGVEVVNSRLILKPRSMESGRRARLSVTGLTPSGNNMVPHGLPRPPFRVIIEPNVAGGFDEYQPADDTKYLHRR